MAKSALKQGDFTVAIPGFKGGQTLTVSGIPHRDLLQSLRQKVLDKLQRRLGLQRTKLRWIDGILYYIVGRKLKYPIEGIPTVVHGSIDDVDTDLAKRVVRPRRKWGAIIVPPAKETEQAAVAA